MPYIMRQYEWPIPESEQEAARFIVKTAHDWNKRKAQGGGVEGTIVHEAFETFKRQFYYRLRRLLDIPDDVYGLREEGFGLGACAISDDGMKLIAWRVAKEED